MADLSRDLRPGRRVRLLWLIDSLTVGGAESLVLPFARSIDARRYDLTVACLTSIAGNAIQTELEKEGARVINLQARRLYDVGAFRRLVRLVRSEAIDLVHAHLTYAAIWSAVLSRITGVPSVATLHVAPPGSGRDRIRDRLLRLLANRWTARVVAVSGALRTMYAESGGIAERKLVALHNGIDVRRFEGQPAECRERIEALFGIPAGVPLAATVSVLRAGKGIEVLLEAAARLSGVHFLIVGDGPMRAEWTELARRLGVADRVHWAGHRSDVETFLAGANLLVHPSLADAFPTVLLEAMAAGLPIVATRVGGIPEIVQDGVTGMLVPANDEAALARAVDELLSDRGRAAAFGTRGHEIAVRLFSTEAWIGRLEALYAGVLDQH